MNIKVKQAVSFAVGIALGGAAVYYYAKESLPQGAVKTDADTAAKAEAGKILYWYDPMEPEVRYSAPGKSSMGMDLVPMYEGKGAHGEVAVSEATSRSIGVRTEKAERRALSKTVRVAGKVDYDEKRIYRVNTKVEGWVEKLYVDSTGQAVKKDDMLLGIYSPQLVSTQEEYLLAMKYGGDIQRTGRESIIELSRRRLELWDVPAHQIKELEETGRIIKTLHIHSPASGIVMEKPVTEGMFVSPGTTLYTIADISRVWVYADVYEYDMPWIKEGSGAEMTLAAYPGEVFRGRVAFIYPFMEEATRTNKVRLEFANPGLKLKPAMYANVTIASTLRKSAVAVPLEAVIRSGERNVVVKALGKGSFKPVEVTLGAEGDGFYEVVSGVDEGDEVVTSAQFLIDSESRLKEAISKLSGGDAGAENERQRPAQKAAAKETSEKKPSADGRSGHSH